LKKTIFHTILLAVTLLLTTGISFRNTVYVCYPCGDDCDSKEYDSPGKCSVCGMELIDRSTIKFTNITPQDVCKITSENSDVVILDVRTKEEYDSKGNTPRLSYGHIKNSINISSAEIDKRLPEIEKYKTKEIIVYCSRGHRSAVVSQYLTDNGFENVKNMTGGLEYWDKTSIENLICKESLLEK
jgi:rhodanese-related sulfurtransferase